MKKHYFWIAFLAAISGFIGGLMTKAIPNTDPSFVTISSSYPLLSFEEVIDLSDAIVLGRILDISSTMWNQDSGEFWDDRSSEISALPYYQIFLEVIDPISDTLSIPEKFVVTEIGISPVDNQFGSEDTGSKIQFRTSEGFEQIGDVGIVFLKKADIAWRDGSIGVLSYTTDPVKSFLPSSSEGLFNTKQNGDEWLSYEEIIGLISQS